MLEVKESDINSYQFISKVQRIHEYLFDNATLKTQMKKYEEERQEFDEVKYSENRSKMLEELADCYICCVGIMRFNWRIGSDLRDFVINVLGCDFDKEDILKYVIKKMKILQTRQWKEETPGYYKHVSENVSTNTEKE